MLYNRYSIRLWHFSEGEGLMPTANCKGEKIDKKVPAQCRQIQLFIFGAMKAGVPNVNIFGRKLIMLEGLCIQNMKLNIPLKEFHTGLQVLHDIVLCQ